MHLFATGKYLRSLPLMGAMQAGKPKHCLKADTTRQGSMVVKVMKLTAFILLIGCLHASAAGHAQKLISLQERNAPVQKIFAAIRKQTGYQFLYANQVIETAKPVTIEVKNASLEEVLQTTFKDQPLEYEIKDKTIIVRLKNEPKAHTATTDNQIPPIDIKGRIVNDKGEPIAGATVMVKGTDKTTITNANGEFSLRDVNEKAVLVITDVRYDAQTIAVNGRAFVGVTMAMRVGMLDEAQVIAYGTTTRRLNTGNVTSVKAADIEKQPVNNPLLALEGRVPGLFITQSNGVPGGGVTVRVQGQNSIRYGNDPFYVIDGVPYFSQLPSTGLDGVLGTSGGLIGANSNGNPLSYINPNDIESIEVLKDADATAIYGSRAANGAILITTKKGKAGQMKLDVNLQNGWGKVAHKWDMLNTRQYLDMRYEALTNDGINLASVSNTNSNYYDLKVWDTTRYTDWQKVLIGRTAQYSNVNATISGGTSNTQYLVSGTYHKETTVFPGNFNDQKGSVHFSIASSTPNQRFHMTLSGNYMVDNNYLPGTDLTKYAVQTEPIAPPLYNVDGTLNWAPTVTGVSTWTNPLVAELLAYNNKTTNLISNFTMSYRILPGLEVLGSVGYTNMHTTDFEAEPLTYYKPELRSTSLRYAFYGNRDLSSWIFEPQVTYKRSIGKGKLDFLLGSTIQQNNSNVGNVKGSGYNSDDVLKNMSAATQLSPGSQYITQYKYNAAFARFNFNWNNKYILNLTGRRDGTSRFGEKNRFHNFGSMGGAWIFSEESWFQHLKTLSLGKVHASYGTTGSDQIGDYAFMSLYNYYGSTGLTYQNTIGIYPGNLPNPYLQWEETKKVQLGIDLGFFYNRLLFSATYGRNRSSNQLLSYALPSITGYTSFNRNFPATVQNTSWEFSLNTINIKGKRFEWSTSANLTIPNNKLIDFPGLATSSYANTLSVGRPVAVTRTYAYDGVDPATGVYEFKRSHGADTASPSFPADALSWVSMLPRFYGGLENEFKFNAFELDFLFQFVKQLGANYDFQNGSRFPGVFVAGQSNMPVTVLDRWQKPGDIANIAKFSSTKSYTSGDKAYTDASYIRLKNVSLSYRLPTKWMQAIHVNNCRVYAQGQNLLTITHWHGLDPESQTYSSLPPLRVWTFGLQAGF